MFSIFDTFRNCPAVEILKAIRFSSTNNGVMTLDCKSNLVLLGEVECDFTSVLGIFASKSTSVFDFQIIHND